MRKIKILLLIVIAAAINTANAQDEAPLDTLTRSVAGIQSDLDIFKRLKFSGYIQGQYQVIDSAGARSFAGGDFASGVDKRFMLRDARLKAEYNSALNEKGIQTSQFVFQLDVTERGVAIKDLYAKFTDPWTGWFSLTTGMQNRPFGFEIIYSSTQRESPERGRMSQIVFPGERDLGAMLTIQGPKWSNWNWLKLEAGMFNGSGAPGAGGNSSDFDKFKDFIGHITATRANKSEMIKWNVGASYYKGGYRLDGNEYTMGSDSAGVNGFILKTSKADISANINTRTSTNREYWGVDGQISFDWAPGITTLRAEYIQGNQPALAGSSTSVGAQPTTTTTTTTTAVVKDTSGKNVTVPVSTTTTTVGADIYERKFNGAYFYFIQNIGHSPLQAIVKYDWYDPNTDVEGDDIGKAVGKGVFTDHTGTPSAYSLKANNATDIKYSTIGVGLAYRWDANVKLTAYYDMVTNETSQNLSGFQKDLKDNVFTFRVQVKF